MNSALGEILKQSNPYDDIVMVLWPGFEDMILNSLRPQLDETICRKCFLFLDSRRVDGQEATKLLN